MPEDPTSPNEAGAAAEPAEWTDDSSFQELVSASDATVTSDDTATEDLPSSETPLVATPGTDEWDVAVTEWDDDVLPPPNTTPNVITTKDALAWLKPAWRRLRVTWQQLLAGLRNRVPAVANLPDGVLSAILLGTLGLLLVLLNSVRQPAIAQPPTSPSPQPAIPVPSEPTPPSEIPPTMPAVGAASETSTASSELADPIDLERIADIQTQLTKSSIYNASRVIDSVQADFTHNRLTLVCNEDWYRLSDYDQDLLANQLLQQSAELAFDDVELQTPTGQLIARNPVIGKEMVVLLRESPPIVEPPERPRFRITIDR
jgi:hypothetical protein